MKKYFYFIITVMIISDTKAGGGSGWGAFAGGFFGASLGNAMTQPREVVVQQPVQREVIIQPANCYSEYIEQPQYVERPQRRKSIRRKNEEETETNESNAWQAKADAERARTERIKAEIELEKLKNNN